MVGFSYFGAIGRKRADVDSDDSMFYCRSYCHSEVRGRVKKMDHGSIVIDEVVAVWFVLLLCPTGLFWQLAGVLVFRFLTLLNCRQQPDLIMVPNQAGRC